MIFFWARSGEGVNDGRCGEGVNNGRSKTNAAARQLFSARIDLQVALALEELAAISGNRVVRRKLLGGEAEKLVFARCCYDHLAGRVMDRALK